jgi:lipoprotein-anchoring transpeptidase ErfK/SrfK
MRLSFLPAFIIAVLSLSFLSGCATPLGKHGPVPKNRQRVIAPASKTNYWQDSTTTGAPRIVIALSEQRAYFYRGRKLVGETSVSTGRSGFETPTGNYHVIQKDQDHVSTLYGEFVDEHGNVVQSNVDITKDHPPAGAVFRGAKMPYFLRFRAGYGLHAGRVPNHRASHGCVRLPREMAGHFFHSAPAGTPVVVKE